MPLKTAIVPIGKIEKRILLIRGEKVIVDADLAQFYGVPTKRLNEQVKRKCWKVSRRLHVSTDER